MVPIKLTELAASKAMAAGCPTGLRYLVVVQLWFELYRMPSGRETDLLEEVLASWFMLGRLGSYNAQNLQVHSPLLASLHLA